MKTARFKPQPREAVLRRAEAVLRHDRDGYIRCRVCGCTEREPCEPACSWAETDLCSLCAEVAEALTTWYLSANRPSLAALRREVDAEIGRQRAGQLAYQSISDKLSRLHQAARHAEARP